MPLLSLPYIVLDRMLEMYQTSLSIWQIPKREPTIIMLEEDPPEPAAEAA
jgi:hypothetical protein